VWLSRMSALTSRPRPMCPTRTAEPFTTLLATRERKDRGMRSIQRVKGLARFLFAVAIASSFAGCLTTDWKTAQQQDSVESYRAFLTKHPSSDYTDAAREKLQWKEAQQKDNLASYSDFLAKYPYSAYSETARKRMESLKEVAATVALSKARELGTPLAYENVTKEYPGTKASLKAARALRELTNPVLLPKHLEAKAGSAFAAGMRYFIWHATDDAPIVQPRGSGTLAFMHANAIGGPKVEHPAFAAVARFIVKDAEAKTVAIFCSVVVEKDTEWSATAATSFAMRWDDGWHMLVTNKNEPADLSGEGVVEIYLIDARTANVQKPISNTLTFRMNLGTPGDGKAGSIAPVGE
jgi:hypothetical protein